MVQYCTSSNSRMNLTSIDDDVLIHMFSFLVPPDILSLGKTCKRMRMLSSLRIVWANACSIHILGRGYPFPCTSMEVLPTSSLEHRTRHAFHLAQKWLKGDCTPHRSYSIDAATSTPVSDVRFLRDRHGKWLISIFTGIWAVITIWDVSAEPQKRCEWSPKGVLFNGFCLNSDPDSEAMIALSIVQHGEHRVDVLSLVESNGTVSLEAILNLTHRDAGRYYRIKQPHCSDHEAGVWKQADRCIQVVFAHNSILVVRARSIHLFPKPVLRPTNEEHPINAPLARYSFGWVDSVSVTPAYALTPSQPLSILIRTETDDPWSHGVKHLDLYTLEPAGASSDIPYTFPPTLKNHMPSALGPCGVRTSSLVRTRQPCGYSRTNTPLPARVAPV
ncbi:hypothetical protein BD779DRAFT_1806094 [Infundibulicybe gibba]|nr:hypothetical protein BD779DRAFT_1806094 [Infundibulicybe gibba]